MPKRELMSLDSHFGTLLSFALAEYVELGRFAGRALDASVERPAGPGRAAGSSPGPSVGGAPSA